MGIFILLIHGHCMFLYLFRPSFISFTGFLQLSTYRLYHMLYLGINTTKHFKILKKFLKIIYLFMFGCAGSSLPRRLFASCGAWASQCGVVCGL